MTESQTTKQGLSVIIPTYYGRTSVAATVRALLCAPESSLEVIVVSDGEASQVRNILRDFDDPRLRLLEAPRAGAASTRNVGLRASQYEWVAFVDDDDTPRSNWVNVWRNHAHSDRVAITAGAATWRDGIESEPVYSRLQADNPTMSAGSILAGTFWVRRDLLEAIGGYDEGLPAAQQQDLGLRLCDYIANRDLATQCLALNDVVIDIHVQEAKSRDARYGHGRADAARIFLDRYAERFEVDPSAKASFLRMVSRSDRLSGDFRAARSTAISAWRLAPCQLQNNKALIIAFLPFLPRLLGRLRKG